ncbi:MAG: Hsp33 family molecular chaperone HslO [Gammaproteobacteria bacterium]
MRAWAVMHEGFFVSAPRDCLRRFLFERHQVRGELVHLNKSFEMALANHPYAAHTASMLGQSLGAVALLTSILKFEGRLTLQLQSDGPLRLLVAQCTHLMNLRGLAQADEDGGASDSLQDQMADGRVVITIEPERGQRYQGIVPLEGDTLSACLELYFERSEQLPTRLWLFANAHSVFGMLLQKLPQEAAKATPPDVAAPDDDAWNRLTMLADTLSVEEIQTLSDEQILHRLFHEEDVRLFDREPVSFRCSCSRERIADALRGLGAQEVDAIIEEQNEIATTCEFCNKRYVFDSVDAAALFQDAASGNSSTAH